MDAVMCQSKCGAKLKDHHEHPKLSEDQNYYICQRLMLKGIIKV